MVAEVTSGQYYLKTSERAERLARELRRDGYGVKEWRTPDGWYVLSFQKKARRAVTKEV